MRTIGIRSLGNQSVLQVHAAWKQACIDDTSVITSAGDSGAASAEQRRSQPKVSLGNAKLPVIVVDDKLTTLSAGGIGARREQNVLMVMRILMN